MAKTESIEALLNPSLRVSRPVAACARCRSAKIKCDGKLPACSACERAGKAKECSSANDDFAKGKERSYVAALETTIQRLQKKIKSAQAAAQAEQEYQQDGLNGNARPPLRHSSVSGSKRVEASNVDELVSDFGFLTVNATSRDFHGFTSTMSFARLLTAMAIKKPLPHSVERQMPSRYTITPLVDHYFKNIYVLLPFFSETSFMSSLSKVYQDQAPFSQGAPIDYWYVRLVLAISAASQCKTKGDSQYETAIQHISAAMKVIELVIHPGSVVGIQALLLLVQYSLVDPEHFDSWYLIGMAARLLVDLGLHCEPAPEAKFSKHALDLRRRVFYCTYALDRQVSMANGYAFSFTDDSAPNVLLPTLAIDLEKRSPTQLFLRSIKPSLFLFDIRRVQSSFYQATRFSNRREWTSTYASDHISSILRDVRAWHSTVPTTFDQRHIQFFYLEYLYSQILAVSPNQNIPIGNVTDQHKALVFYLSLQFVDQMQLMVQHADSQAFLTYADICRTKFVGRQFQDVIWSNFDQLLRYYHTFLSDVSIAQTSPYENCGRAISLITKTTAILDFARARWGINELREKFEQETAVLLARLQNKQQDFAREAFPPSVPNYASATHGLVNISSHTSSLPTYEHMYNNVHASQDDQMQQFHASTSVITPAVHRSSLTRSNWSNEGQGNADMSQGLNSRHHSYEFTGHNSMTANDGSV